MISSRFLFASLAGIFSLALGLFALIKRPRPKLNLFFALYALGSVPVILPAPEFISHLFGHDTALYFYRIFQLGHPTGVFFLLCFLQEFSGVYNHITARRLRWSGLLLILLLAPFYFTPHMIIDFHFEKIGSDARFFRETGTLYVAHVGISLFLLMSGVVTTYKGLMQSTGIKRNQMMFISFGIGLGLIGVLLNHVSLTGLDLPWLYFPMWMGMSFCFAYAIFKHQLFEFDLWLRRLSIYVGVYLAIAVFPVFLLFPFRDILPAQSERFWVVLCLIMIGYGVLFSLAPGFVYTLRRRSEQKRWDYLHHQLEFMAESSELLAEETGLTLNDVSERVVDMLTEFYWERMKTPLAFVAAVCLDQRDKASVSIFPGRRVDENVLVDFIKGLKSLPAPFIQKPFGLVEVIKVDHATIDLDAIKKYLGQNQIEICCPCVHDGHIKGVLLFGPKKDKIFWPEELSTLQITSSHMATAVRKSELLSTTRELKDLDQLKKELIANITHEFKTPLYVIENAVDILLRDVGRGNLTREKIGKYLLMVKNNAGELGFFIQNLLEVARIEQAKVDLNLVNTDLKAILTGAVHVLEPLADKKGLKFVLKPMDSIMMQIDAAKIQQVFNNLYSNAVKFTSNGTITTSLKKNDRKVLVQIKDTGQGIDPLYQAHIFNKFFQISSANHRAKGTGLGLAIAKGWVEAHGGRIWAQSDGRGKGSVFFVEIPIKNETPA